MQFLGEVGNTFRLRRKSASFLYVIITKPNKNGLIVVVPLVTPIKSIQSYQIFTARDDGNLFKSPKTPKYQNTQFFIYKNLVAYINSHIDRWDHDCQPDVLREIIAGAFKSGLTAKKFLKDLEEQYPGRA